MQAWNCFPLAGAETCWRCDAFSNQQKDPPSKELTREGATGAVEMKPNGATEISNPLLAAACDEPTVRGRQQQACVVTAHDQVTSDLVAASYVLL